MTTIEQIEKKVFKFASSKADKRYFKTQLTNWIAVPKPQRRETWTQLLEKMVFARNSGKDFKYCYYCKVHKRVFVTPSFRAWALATGAQISKLLNQLHA